MVKPRRREVFGFQMCVYKFWQKFRTNCVCYAPSGTSFVGCSKKIVQQEKVVLIVMGASIV